MVHIDKLALDQIDTDLLHCQVELVLPERDSDQDYAT
jgi:hypothetical protein